MPQKTLPAGIASRRWTPYVALALSLLFTSLMTAYLLWAASTRDQVRFERLTSEIEANIQGLLSTYIALLRAGEGFVSVNEETLTREMFGEFVAALDLEGKYPGM